MKKIICQLLKIFLVFGLVCNRNQISIKIVGNGTQRILSDSYKGRMPDTVIINDNGDNITYNNTGKFVYGLTQLENNITMIWDCNITDLNSMFMDLINVIQIDFSEFYSSNVYNMSKLFFNCSKLTSLILSNFDTSSIISMNRAFAECSSLQYLNIKNFNTSSVTDMEYMFSNCQSLISLDITNFDTSLVTNMHGLFYRCTKLTSLNLTNFKTSNVVTMNDMFSECKGLLSLNLNNFITSNVTDMDHLFCSCSSMTDLHIDNFDTSKVTTMTGMFERCSLMKTFNITHFNISSVKSIYAAFKDCTSLNSLDLSSFDTSAVNSMYLTFQNCISLTTLDLSNFNTSKVENMESMFEGSINLKVLNLSNFRTPLLNNIKKMFQNCTSLETIDISNFDISNVKDISYMFSECHNLTSLKLNNINTSGIEIMMYMFENCYSLKSLNLSNFDTSSVTDMDYAFKGCKNLMILDLNNLNFSKVRYKTGIFKDINNNLSFCINGSEGSQIFTELISSHNISNNCPCYLNPNNKIIFDNYKCINNCINDPFYSYEYNNKCYSSCPNGTKINSNIKNLCEDIPCKNNYYNYNQTECIDEIPKGYFLNDSYLRTIDICDIKCGDCSLESNQYNLCISCNIEKKYYEIFNDSSNYNSFINCYNEKPDGYTLEDNIYKPCFHSCKNCSGIGNESDNKCISCSNGYEFKNDFDNDSNCYNICNYYYYFDSNKKFYCTSDDKCPIEYNKLIIEKGKCVSNCTIDDKYKCQYNNTCILCQNITEVSSKINLDNMTLENITQLNESFIIDEYNLKEFFNNNYKINNKTDIKIDAKLKDKIIDDIRKEIMNGDSMDKLINNLYNGDKNDLVIEDDNIIYQITSTENQENNDNINISTINLGECGKILKNEYNISKNQSLIIFKIDYFQEGSLIPIIGYEIYNPLTKKKLNLDSCKNTTINLNIPVDIKEENLYKYDPENEYYTDICNPSTTESGTDILLNDRHNEFNINNMSLCEKNCKYTNYNNDNKKALCQCGIKNENLVISDLVNQNDLLSYEFENKKDMITMKCYKTLFTKDGLIGNIGNYVLLFVILLFMISLILFYKCGYNLLEDKMKKIYSIKLSEKENENINIKETIVLDNKNCRKKEVTKSNKIKRRNQKSNIEISENNNYNDKINSKLEFNIVNYDDNTKNKIIKKGNIQNNLKGYEDYELNLLLYEDAIKYDKRGFCGYYISLIKRKHPLIFHFCQINDYNSIIIKVCLFFLSFSIYYFINTLFFDESTIHQIYENKGIYKFTYLAPHISYSFIISHTLSIILKFIFLSERNIFEIKTLKNIDEIDSMMDKIKRCLVIKYICFFVLSIIFLSFFWYYLSSFGAVFQNTQIYIIKNTSICIGVSLIYPFVINIFPSIIRIYSLSVNNRKFSYNFNKFLQYI